MSYPSETCAKPAVLQEAINCRTPPDPGGLNDSVTLLLGNAAILGDALEPAAAAAAAAAAIRSAFGGRVPCLALYSASLNITSRT